MSSFHSSFLFSIFPREVGIPQFKPVRRVVHRQKELDQFIDQYNGLGDVYTSVYDNSLLIDKVFFDFDGVYAFEFARKFANWLYIKGISYIPVITGKKGFHIYPLIYPQHLHTDERKQKAIIQMAQEFLIDRSKCYYPIHGEIYDIPKELKDKYKHNKRIDFNDYHLISDDPIVQAKYSDNKIIAYVRILEGLDSFEGNWWYTPACDTQIMGDIRRLCRVPNTKRILGNGIENYCTYLPIRFFELSEIKVFSYQKTTNYVPRPSGVPIELKYILRASKVEFSNAIITNFQEKGKVISYEVDSTILETVRHILNPGIFRSLHSPEPPNKVRVAAVCEMKHVGLSKQEIVNILLEFNWSDKDQNIISDKVEQIFRKDYPKFCKSTLIGQGLATNRDFLEKKKRFKYQWNGLE